MVLFLHALRICTIASVSVTIRSYVLITADVEDFKNLARTFLSPVLAEKLTALVAESGHDFKKQQADEKVKNISFSDIGNIVKDELFKSYKTSFNISTEKSTYSPTTYSKRYKTVKSHGNKRDQVNDHYILRQPDKIRLEPLYLKDKLENRSEKRMDDYTYHDDNKKLDYSELRLNERNKIYSQEKKESKGMFDEIIDQNVNTYYDDNKKHDSTKLRLNKRNKIYSQETTISTGLFDEIIDQNVKDMDDMFKKLDYTETKLGEWNFYPKTSQEPVNIKNVKTGYMYYLGVNNEDVNADIEEPVLKEDMFTENYFIDIHKEKTTEQATEKNIINDKLIIGSKTTNNDNTHTNPLRVENHGTYNQFLLETEQEESQENKPEGLSVDENNKYDTFLMEPKNKDSVVKKNREKPIIERDTVNQFFLGSKHKNIPEEKSKKLPKQYNNMYETQILWSENEVSGERKNEVQQLKEQEHKTLNQHISESKQKGIHKEKKKKSLKNEHNMYESNMSVRNKHNSSNTKNGKDKNEKQFYNIEPSIIDKEKKKKPQKQLIEENDMYDKYALNYKTEDSYEGKVSHKKMDDSDQKLEIEKKINHKSATPDKHKHYKSNSDENISLKNKKQRFGLKALKFNKNSKTDQTIKTMKKVLPENRDDSQLDDREVQSEDIKAKTEYLVDYVEITSTTKDIKAKTENLQDDSVEIQGKATKRFMMKRTEIPKRDFYKMSTPDYYNKLPKVVEKYNFEEPIPEKDRERVKEKYVKREPALINKKIRLS